MVGKEYWREYTVPYKEAGTVIDNRLYGVWSNSDIDDLAAPFTSSIYPLMREMRGWTVQGEGMDQNFL